ncbi:DUF5107 domain-containing protein [Vibrio sp. VB16]|uniref:DUF5107 domain-containing protein n=1 Tax=Vibrio sp. VB16 TaxID=2785746 RepID=UPI00189DF287|nr:DUF5107 domain-containing protein [Vibrio sp. VB16]UGA53625.1 DUF5107 domain-containing protein [Vibrio sp. VB16]
MESKARVWSETVVLPTYPTGAVDTNPLFLEKRVYQGSSGAVYPYGVIDSINDELIDKEYNAIFLENDYIKVMLLPELGGRIHKAYDKVRDRDFVYCNDVIKPALVGLIGPWISGGIEFNWPQHHRPTTYMPVDVNIRTHDDGSAEVWLGEVEHMYGLQISAGFKLYPNKALIEITGKVYNGNPTPRQFLWWSNPAVKGGEDHQSIFPPDVTAVYDHGKRDVSEFPIAKGTYYKVDYSPGTDISRYNNLPVPTSYMAAGSDYDFVGAYSHNEAGGLLHIANHHISPGKKQWTWGDCDFGLAWDKNLTDTGGPYIELMTGVFTDNQPDFTWIDSNEEKVFVQNFLPYSQLGSVHQANTDLALKLHREDREIEWGIYAISQIENCSVVIKSSNTVLVDEIFSFEPCQVHLETIEYSSNEKLTIVVTTQNGQKVLSYTELDAAEEAIPEPAQPPLAPQNVSSIEELYLIGQHLEQYHHASGQSEDYYQEALHRDPLDYRCNLALANREYERCDYDNSLALLNNALDRAHRYNKNPACGRASFLRGCVHEKMGQLELAYQDYYKSTWSGNCGDIGFMGASRLSFIQHRYTDALEEINRSLELNRTSYHAAFIKAVILDKLDKTDEAKCFIDMAIQQFPLGYALFFEKYRITSSDESKQIFSTLCQRRQANAIHVSGLYQSLGLMACAIRAIDLIDASGANSLLIKTALDGEMDEHLLTKAEQEFSQNVLFPNTQIEWYALTKLAGNPFVDYQLGCFYYAKKSYEKAVLLWKNALTIRPDFKECHRNLSVYYANKKQDLERALCHMSYAWELDSQDARVLFELDHLSKLIGRSPEDRLDMLNKHQSIVLKRDDLSAEWIALLNISGNQARALDVLESKVFHPWEGGEGRITGQYINALLRQTEKLVTDGKYTNAKQQLVKSLTYPDNLSEGRLVGQSDNDIYFMLGCLAEIRGNAQEAQQYWQKATLGSSELTESRYYNDQPADYLFFQALALAKLGEKDRALKRFTVMRNWANDHLSQDVYEDFFAVSLPELNVFDRDIIQNHQVHCRFIRYLSSLGEGLLLDTGITPSTQDKAALLKLEPGHGKTRLIDSLLPLLTTFFEHPPH